MYSYVLWGAFNHNVLFLGVDSSAVQMEKQVEEENGEWMHHFCHCGRSLLETSEIFAEEKRAELKCCV